MLHAHEVAGDDIVSDAEIRAAVEELDLGDGFDAIKSDEVGLQRLRVVRGMDAEVGAVGMFDQGQGGAAAKGNQAGDEDDQ